jgi:nucleotide-binding universal stress UspA family protein
MPTAWRNALTILIVARYNDRQLHRSSEPLCRLTEVPMAHDLTPHGTLGGIGLRPGVGSGGVLVGYDGSLSSEHAVAYANGLARRTNAQLLVANVDQPSEVSRYLAALAGYPWDPYLAFEPSLGLLREYTYVPPACDEKGRRLERQIRSILGSRAAPWTLLHRTGHVVDELRHLAHEYKADAVVVGKSRRPLRHPFGSIAGRLARHCEQPVLIIP